MSEDNEFHKMKVHKFMTFHCTLWRNGKPIQDSPSHLSKMVVREKFWYACSPCEMKSCYFFWNYYLTYKHKWLKCLSYLTDTFQVSVNWTFHVRVHLWRYFLLMTKVKQSLKKKKIRFWKSCVAKEITECFPTFHDFLPESETSLFCQKLLQN